MLIADQISKSFPTFKLADISFRVNQGDYFVLLGPSGSGKSILLKVLVGLVSPDKGRVFLDGKNITHEPVGQRQLGILFQDLAIFPHMNVFDNIAYPLKVKGLESKSVKKRVHELAERFSISNIIKRDTRNLSGGELQRVAMARTLALNPRVLLLDEPLSALDTSLHLEISALLRELNRNGTTMIHVTHSFDEAITLANRVGVIRNGSLVQVGETLKVFQNPNNDFVAHFTGARNFFKVEQTSDSQHGLVIGNITNNHKIAFFANSNYKSGYILFSEAAVVLAHTISEQSALNIFKGKVVDVFAQPYGYEVVLDCGFRIHAHITWESKEKLNIEPGVELFASIKASAIRFIPGA
ncbi:ABC transporter ATP-binding protein [Tenuifilum thalassicum]|uniref:ATP-binding cassette domain-containing protein n=1 Tax=Tenuifilum thalassicum TaxID=2590900 RepID=A0A7D4CHH9_9BACT|nr:ATP-binding cassette domain-containing protein [Tenuifilum thalassicum]QKG80526.1 ATP-binding cassette domain-containing protein [Tenuifilum thalassicum]